MFTKYKPNIKKWIKTKLFRYPIRVFIKENCKRAVYIE